jgi:dihydroorotase
MQIRTIERLELLPTADMHVHLRQAELMELAVPAIGKGGVDTVFVYGSIPSKILKVMKELTKDHRMPNLVRGVFSLVFDYFSLS